MWGDHEWDLNEPASHRIDVNAIVGLLNSSGCTYGAGVVGVGLVVFWLVRDIQLRGSLRDLRAARDQTFTFLITFFAPYFL